MGDIAVMTRHLFYQRGRDKRPLFGGHQEHALQLRHQVAVHVRQLHLILEVCHRAQTTDQNIGLLSAGEVCHQVAKPDHLNIRQVRNGIGGELYALVEVKHRLFAGAGGNSQNHLVKHARRTGDDIKMTVGDRIEGTRINRFCAHGSRFL